ncbi:hypothetical protein NMM52_20660, partial [Acinetobacter baumannii]|nr:hypothetical protein [Acinetobacter baumannii]
MQAAVCALTPQSSRLAADKNIFVILGTPGCRFVSGCIRHVICHGLSQQTDVAREGEPIRGLLTTHTTIHQWGSGIYFPEPCA